MFYWLILFLIVASVFLKRKNSGFYLNIAINIFVGGVILRLIGFGYLAEFLLRVDFIFWLVGLSLAIRENRYEN